MTRLAQPKRGLILSVHLGAMGDLLELTIDLAEVRETYALTTTLNKTRPTRKVIFTQPKKYSSFP